MTTDHADPGDIMIAGVGLDHITTDTLIADAHERTAFNSGIAAHDNGTGHHRDWTDAKQAGWHYAADARRKTKLPERRTHHRTEGGF